MNEKLNEKLFGGYGGNDEDEDDARRLEGWRSGGKS
jgi:hypothetical protein